MKKIYSYYLILVLFNVFAKSPAKVVDKKTLAPISTLIFDRKILARYNHLTKMVFLYEERQIGDNFIWFTFGYQELQTPSRNLQRILLKTLAKLNGKKVIILPVQNNKNI